MLDGVCVRTLLDQAAVEGPACRRAHCGCLVLQEAEKRGKKLFLYTGPQPQARANAAVLVSTHEHHQQHGHSCSRLQAAAL